MTEISSSSSQPAKSNVIANFRKPFNYPLLSDVKFETNDATLYGHKSIISAKSEFFRTQYDHGTRPSDVREEKIASVNHVNHSAAAFEQVLRYLYGGLTNIDLPIVSPIVELDVLSASEHYRLPELTSEMLCRINSTQDEKKRLQYYQSDHPEIRIQRYQHPRSMYREDLDNLLSLSHYINDFPRSLTLYLLIQWVERNSTPYDGTSFNDSICELMNDIHFNDPQNMIGCSPLTYVDVEEMILKPKLFESHAIVQIFKAQTYATGCPRFPAKPINLRKTITVLDNPKGECPIYIVSFGTSNDSDIFRFNVERAGREVVYNSSGKAKRFDNLELNQLMGGEKPDPNDSVEPSPDDKLIFLVQPVPVYPGYYYQVYVNAVPTLCIEAMEDETIEIEKLDKDDKILEIYIL